MTTFSDPPLSLLDDPPAFFGWMQSVGSEEGQRQLTEASRRHIQEHGARSALDIDEKLAHVIAWVEEFAVE